MSLNIVERISEGWDHLVSRASSAITHFSHDESDTPDEVTRTSSWGLLSADLIEDGDTITVEIEAPGMKPDDFDVTVRDRMLAVAGSKRYADDRTEGETHISERAYGRFERVFHLPGPVDESNVDARYKDGVLRLQLHRTGDSNVRRIPVN